MLVVKRLAYVTLRGESQESGPSDKVRFGSQAVQNRGISAQPQPIQKINAV